MTLSIMILNLFATFSTLMISLTTLCRYAEFHYAECRYAECRYAECRYAECRIYWVFWVLTDDTPNNNLNSNHYSLL